MGVPGTTSTRRGPYIYYRGRGCVAVMGCALLLLLATICCFRGAAVATHQRHQNHIQQQPTNLLKPRINSGGIGISTGRRTGVVGVTVGVGSSSVAATSTIGGQYGVNRPSGDGGGIDGFLDGGTATSTVEWSGGITCDKCASWNYTSHYACSSDSNSWANGVKSFVDPTPFGSVITEITFFLMGVYSCTSFTTPASILLYLGRKQVDTDSTTFPLSTCRCPNCAMQVVLTETGLQGWPTYNTSGINTIQVVVLTNSICLSYITILFTYDFTPSTVSSLFPNCGPISGGTQVLVYGNNFFESSQINCHFGNQIGNGTYISDTTIECTAPPSPEKGVFNFTVSYKADASLAISQAVYTFYDQVVLLKVDPSSGLIAGGTTLRLSGNNIYDTGSLLSCMFTGHDGTVEFAEGKYETGDVLCTTPEWTQKETVNLSLALNSQQFCTPILFSFKDENFLEQHTIGVLVLLVCIILFSGTMIATVALCRRRKKQRLPQVLLSTETLDMQDIQLEGRIGSGTFGEVYKAKWRGVTIAIKRLPPAYSGNEFQQKFRKEVDIMRSLRHPNVLQFFGCCMDPPDMCFAMEYMPKGSLYSILHNPTITIEMDRILSILKDTARGCHYLHSCTPPILHRDLKSHNLLVDENWRVKVCDFGLSAIFENVTTTLTACGTPSWTAPEVLRRVFYSEKADIYSFGVVMWECVAREDPYRGISPYTVIFGVANEKLRPDLPRGVHPLYARLTTECWQEEPIDRPSFDTILQRLSAMSSRGLPPLRESDKVKSDLLRTNTNPADLAPPPDNNSGSGSGSISGKISEFASRIALSNTSSNCNSNSNNPRNRTPTSSTSPPVRPHVIMTRHSDEEEPHSDSDDTANEQQPLTSSGEYTRSYSTDSTDSTLSYEVEGGGSGRIPHWKNTTNTDNISIPPVGDSTADYVGANPTSIPRGYTPPSLGSAILGEDDEYDGAGVGGGGNNNNNTGDDNDSDSDGDAEAQQPLLDGRGKWQVQQQH